MKKLRILCAAVCMGIVMSGCSSIGASTSTFSPDQNSIFVSREGAISSALVETYEENYYDQAELQSFVETAVKDFNISHGREEEASNQEGKERLPAALQSCILKEGKAVVVFEYGDEEAFRAFTEEYGDTENHTDYLKIATVGDGLEKGLIAGTDFVKADGSGADFSEIMKKSDLQMVAVKGPVLIQTEGKILYMTAGCTLKDPYTAMIPEGTANLIFK